jgi:hypothetical protein
MSQPSLELTLEVTIFEYLEQATSLTLGQLTKLRLKSRGEQVNLLFLAYQEKEIDTHIAQRIAKSLGINTHSAPWIEDEARHNMTSSHQSLPDRPQARDGYESSTGSSHSPMASSHFSQSPIVSSHLSSSSSLSSSSGSGYSARRKFSERASLTEALKYADETRELSTVKEVRQKKRQFSDINQKTKIEINLPSLMEEMHSQVEMPSLPQAPSLRESITPHPKAIAQPSVRWSSLTHRNTKSHLDMTIHRYQIEDSLLERTLSLTTMSPIDHIHSLNRLDVTQDLPILNAYKLISRYLKQEILEISTNAEGSHVYWQIATQGERLDQYLLPSTSIGERRLLAQRVLSSVSQQLAPIHRGGIVHRALDPSCIYMQGQEFLIDSWEWCFDYTSTNNLSMPTTIQVSPWVAPEIHEQKRLTGSDWVYADIYSLGVLIFWILTGSLPPSSSQVQKEMLVTQLDDYPSPQLVSGCLAAMNSLSSNRPQSVEELYHLAYGSS